MEKKRLSMHRLSVFNRLNMCYNQVRGDRK